MDYCFDADLPIEEVYRLLMKEEEKDRNRIVICYCGCGETYRYGDEINFRKKTNLKHLIFQRDKMTKENEKLKDYIDEYEKEKQRQIDVWVSLMIIVIYTLMKTNLKKLIDI